MAVRINPDTLDAIDAACGDYGFTRAGMIDVCVNFALRNFKEHGIHIDPLPIAQDPQARERLVEDSAAMCLQGVVKYSEWLSMLTPEQQEVLKHCMKHHKEIAAEADKKQNLKKIADNYSE